MKHKQKLMGFVSGCLATAALITSPMAVELVAQTLEVYSGVKVYVDDKKIDAGNTNGNPEAFIYNGTTYVAVAAVSNSLGETVRWDGANKSVYIGKHGETPSILDVCPPMSTTV